MKLHYIQHVHFETPANILKWAKEKNIHIKGTKIFLNEELPSIDEFDILVVMGGPMGIYDEKDFPWLFKEKRFIEKAISKNKKVIGVCLGAQLIADILGAKVYKNRYKEIGWFPVYKTKQAKGSKIFYDFPESFTAFHWHGDTFEIPKGAVHTFYSEGCKNQAFEYNNGKVVALQFHLETNEESAKALIQNSVEDLKEKGKYVQNAEDILSKKEYFSYIKNLLYKLMDRLSKI